MIFLIVGGNLKIRGGDVRLFPDSAPPKFLEKPRLKSNYTKYYYVHRVIEYESLDSTEQSSYFVHSVE